jgi:hypothetical protein
MLASKGFWQRIDHVLPLAHPSHSATLALDFPLPCPSNGAFFVFGFVVIEREEAQAIKSEGVKLGRKIVALKE